MDKNILEILTVNRDAIATNRGFYFQYLNLLKKWIENFITGNGNRLYSEVGDDIKEIGDRLIFTQLKCYSSSFSLNSKPLKTAIFAFFVNYLKESTHVPLSFIFQTNTSLGKNEKLVREWIENYPLQKSDLSERCRAKISAILTAGLKASLRSKLEKEKLSDEKKSELRKAFNDFTLDMEPHLMPFTLSLKWEFSDQPPEIAINALMKEIKVLLGYAVFNRRPVGMLLDVLLSQIYRSSQMGDQEDRLLDANLINGLLGRTDKELSYTINAGITQLFQTEIKFLQEQISQIKGRQDVHEEEIGRLKEANSDIMNRAKVPKELTLIPAFAKHKVVAREAMIKEMSRLLVGTNQLNLVGAGGVGKSTLVKVYLNAYYEEFDHILWLDADGGIAKALVANEGINLSLDIDLGQQDGGFSAILYKLNGIEGNNIIILDNYTTDKKAFGQLSSLRNWKILSTSRQKNSNSVSMILKGLDFSQAKQLYCYHAKAVPNDAVLIDFFEFVQYNTLMIELSAKTVVNSLNLNLESFTRYLKEQKLDDLDLAIDVEYGDEEDNIQVFSFLKATFTTAELSEHELWLVGYFSVLPSEDILIADLVDMAGQSYRQRNRQYFINHINRLEQKGWLERDGEKVSMHRLIQQVIIYHLRITNGFIGFAFFITWLNARFFEGHRSSPSLSLRYLRYGESILNAIKEDYRTGIYQPLLLMENEVLLLYTTYLSEIDVLERWKALELRALAYLGPYQPEMGTILNNVGMSLVKHRLVEEALERYLKAAEIFRRIGAPTIKHLFSVLTNAIMIYAETNRMEAVKAIMLELSGLRKDYGLGNNASVILQGNALALANQKNHNFPVAIELYELIIELFYELPTEQRNVIHLVGVLGNLTLCLMSIKKIDEAIAAQEKAIDLLLGEKLDQTFVFRDNIDVLYSLYVNFGRVEQGTKLLERYGKL